MSFKGMAEVVFDDGHLLYIAVTKRDLPEAMVDITHQLQREANYLPLGVNTITLVIQKVTDQT